MATAESPFTRYAIAVPAIAIATALRLLLNLIFGQSFPLITLVLAVLFTVWWGGFGPAVLATFLGAVAAVLFLLPSRGAPGFDPVQTPVNLVLYVVVGLGISWCGGMLHAARGEAQRQRELYRTTLASIGDAVIATDSQGRVTFLNQIAE